MPIDAEWAEGEPQVLPAAWMVALVAVEDFEHLLTAGGEQEVVSPGRVLGDGEHRPAVVGGEHVAGSQQDLAGRVDRSSGLQRATRLIDREREQVCDLVALGIDDPQHLAAPQGESMPLLGWDAMG